ncbi:MAG: hypothetical protein ABIH46_06115, partial [Chloroflexota bacterium]
MGHLITGVGRQASRDSTSFRGDRQTRLVPPFEEFPSAFADEVRPEIVAPEIESPVKEEAVEADAGEQDSVLDGEGLRSVVSSDSVEPWQESTPVSAAASEEIV